MITSLFLAVALSGAPSPQIPMSQAPTTQVAVICFKSGERSAGMNKICYYDCLGSDVAITIGAVELCPLTINN